jgi:hypothetical protein
VIGEGILTGYLEIGNYFFFLFLSLALFLFRKIAQRKCTVHALHPVYVLPDLRVAAVRAAGMSVKLAVGNLCARIHSTRRLNLCSSRNQRLTCELGPSLV